MTYSVQARVYPSWRERLCRIQLLGRTKHTYICIAYTQSYTYCTYKHTRS